MTVSEVGQTGGNTAEASQVVAVVEQGSAFTLSVSSATRETILVEVSRREGSAVPVSGEESSWDLT
jgi:hypothetical protein